MFTILSKIVCYSSQFAQIEEYILCITKKAEVKIDRMTMNEKEEKNRIRKTQICPCVIHFINIQFYSIHNHLFSIF